MFCDLKSARERIDLKKKVIALCSSPLDTAVFYLFRFRSDASKWIKFVGLKRIES